MRTVFVFLCILCAVTSVFAQPPDSLWSRTYGGGECYSVKQTSDGGYILGGWTWSSVRDFYLVRTDASGNQQWNRTFGGSGDDWCYSAQQTSDGGYVVAGITTSYGAGGWDGWLIKTDPSGNEQWNRTFGTSGYDICMAAQQTPDGGYALAGFTDSFGAGSWDGWLIKTDPTGNEQWNRTFGGSEQEHCYCFQQTSDAGYILAGFTEALGSADFWLVKTDANGIQQWNRMFGGSNVDVCYSVQQTSDGGYVLAGQTDSFGAGDIDIWVVRTDANGDSLWSHTYGGAAYELCRSVQEASDGGFVLAGYTMSYGAGDRDFYLVKTDQNGIQQWSRTFGGSSEDWCFSVRQTSDGGYALAGYAMSYGAGGADFWLVKTGPERPDISLTMQDPYVGCPAVCSDDTLYLGLNLAGYYSGQVILQLPPELEARWTGVLTEARPDPPLRTAHLAMCQAQTLSGNRIEVNAIWGPDPDRSVADGLYFAALPLHNTSTTHGQELAITTVSYDFADASGEHTTDLTVATASMTVDCQGPVTSLSGGTGEPSCDAYNSATDFVNALTYDVQAGASPNSPLDHAYIVVNADTFNLTSFGGTWPSSGEAAAVWAAMTEGCNTFVLHAFDIECNENTATVTGVIKDITPPTATPTMNQPLCYNNEPTSPQYGASLIATDLNINATVGSGPCIASTGTLQLGYGASVYPTTPVALPVTTWPDGVDAAALWTWMVSVLPSEFSGTATFGIIVRDCAGNELTPHPIFNVCIDLHKPDNTFSIFDARPTYLGVWLKWQWNYNATQATAAEIWRKGEGDYPVYAHNYSLDLANYELDHTQLAGWTRVLIQAGASGTTSAAWDANPLHHHMDPTLGDYWKDEIGTNGDQQRDIYRYVTFVRDAAGNWSQVESYVLLTNADRSTNYWLGDYSDAGGWGIVDGPDLALLSAGYFKTTVAGGGPAANYLDIGPENHENAYGKGIPNPDQVINFYDLLPFSFNFGVVGSGGFLLAPPPTRPFSTLDEPPVVSLTRSDDNPVSAGDVFAVTITVSGNAANMVKAAEAVLAFDADVLEVVSAVSGDIEVQDGLPFTAARLVEGRNGEVGVCAAAIGPSAYLAGDFTLGTVQLRWTNERAASTSLRIASYELADGAGNVLSGEGQVLAIGTASSVPTRFALYPNYPNPFNPATQIAFDLASEVNVQLVIYNVMGQQVRTLVYQPMAAGAYRVTWNGLDDHNRPAGSGLYLYRLVAGNFVDSKKMVLIR